MTIVGLHPEELFDKLLAGEITLLERERLRAHLDACELCRFEYAARLDFQAEALTLALTEAPPLWPLRPAPVAEAPVRRQRSRLLVWGIAAAALITASGALASALVGKPPWHAFSLVAAGQGSPSARALAASKKPAALTDVRAAVASTPVAAAPELAAASEVAAPARAHPAPHRAASPLLGRRGSTPVAMQDAAAATGAVPPAAAGAPSKDKDAAGPAKLFADANQARRSGDIGRASGLYHLLQDQFPGSAEAELSRVTLAFLLLDNGDAQGALAGFERYLAGAAHGLEAEALVGRARALGRLGRRDLEALAWQEVERKYPRSIYGRQAAERLAALGQP